jgi:hypothetical protein
MVEIQKTLMLQKDFHSMKTQQEQVKLVQEQEKKKVRVSFYKRASKLAKTIEFITKRIKLWVFSTNLTSLSLDVFISFITSVKAILVRFAKIPSTPPLLGAIACILLTDSNVLI